MEIKITVPLTQKHVYNFMMHHAYFSFMGYIGILISVCAIGAMIVTWGKMPLANEAVLLLAALLFTVFQPLMLYARAKRQTASNEAFRIPMTYELTAQGMLVKQGDAEKLFRPEEITRITSTSLSVLIYTGKNHAFILTKEALGDRLEDLRIWAKQCRQATYVKIK